MSDDLNEYRAAPLGAAGGLSWLACAAGLDAEGASVFVASSGAIDRYGDVVEQSWRLANFRRNPVILHEHMVPVVGRGSVKVDKDADALMLSVQWDDDEVNPVGRLVAHQHRTGMRSAVSVGFRPGRSISRAKLDDDHPAKVASDVPEWQAGYLYRSNELLEVSSVAVPANPEALQLRSYAMEAEDPEEQVMRYLAASTPTKLRALLSSYLDANPAALGVLRTIVLGTPDPRTSGNTRKIQWRRSAKE